MESLVSSQWLADNLGAEDLVVLDASMHLPNAERDARAEFEAGHVPGARFLDLASFKDPGSPVPAALPNAEQVAARLAALGVRLSDRVVIYDDSAVKTSARAWFALHGHGFETVAILDGGLGKWKAEGRPLEAGAVAVEPTDAAAFPAIERVAAKSEILEMLRDHDTTQILDARAADRVFGKGIDPVHGGQNGRIPGSLNLPFGKVFREDGTFKAPQDLRTTFEAAGVDLDEPLVTTCGSGVTASVLLFAAHLAGIDDVRLYDGSWMEWEADPEAPKEQGLPGQDMA